MHLLKTLLHKRKYLISTAVLLNILSVLWTLLWNIQLRHIIDSVSKGQVIPGNMVVRALIMIAVISIFSLLSESISGLSCEVMTHDLRMGFACRLAEMSLPELEQINAGEEVSGFQNEIGEVSDYMTENMVKLAGDAVRFAGTLILLLSVCPILTAGAYLPVAGIVAYVFYSSKIIGPPYAAGAGGEKENGRICGYYFNSFSYNTHLCAPGFCGRGSVRKTGYGGRRRKNGKKQQRN